jgi:hypothetical protein
MQVWLRKRREERECIYLKVIMSLAKGLLSTDPSSGAVYGKMVSLNKKMLII